jgi:hypothetical protein
MLIPENHRLKDLFRYLSVNRLVNKPACVGGLRLFTFQRNYYWTTFRYLLVVCNGLY